MGRVHIYAPPVMWKGAQRVKCSSCGQRSAITANPARPLLTDDPYSRMRNEIVISCFDLSCNMVQPWLDAGYTCYCVDMGHPAGETREGNLIRVGADVRDWLPPRGEIAAAFFFPPCTDVAVSGARWFKDKGLGALIGALELFDWSVKIAEWTGAPYLIENPVSTVSTYWRKPDHLFQPWQYGDGYDKKTCLWTGGGFVMPAPTVTERPENTDQRIWKMPPSEDRARLRSITPPGFAEAVFHVNRTTP